MLSPHKAVAAYSCSLIPLIRVTTSPGKIILATAIFTTEAIVTRDFGSLGCFIDCSGSVLLSSRIQSSAPGSKFRCVVSIAPLLQHTSRVSSVDTSFILHHRCCCPLASLKNVSWAVPLQWHSRLPKFGPSEWDVRVVSSILMDQMYCYYYYGYHYSLHVMKRRRWRERHLRFQELTTWKRFIKNDWFWDVESFLHINRTVNLNCKIHTSIVTSGRVTIDCYSQNPNIMTSLTFSLDCNLKNVTVSNSLTRNSEK